jgi:asparagine synthase (glutamine-hydrolysing)
LREWAEELLDGSRIRRDGFLDGVRVQACWHEHLSGRSDRAGELWAILMVQAWLDAMRNPYAPPASTAAVKAVTDSAILADPRTQDYQVLH